MATNGDATAAAHDLPAKANERSEGEVPQDDSDVVVASDGKKYKMAQEGLARIYVPQSTAEKERRNGGGGPAVDDVPQQVFYNPIQQFNRDLSVLAIKAYGKEVVERRTEAFAKRKAAFANKKRKRQDRAALAERPNKLEKRDDGAAVAAPEAAKSDETPHETSPEASEAQTDAPVEASTETNGQAETTAAEIEEASNLPKIRILDALSATGLRALRYAHELPFGVSVTANDLLSAATDSIQRNVELNGLADKITVTRSNAIGHMYSIIAAGMAAEADNIDSEQRGTTSRAARGGGVAIVGNAEKYDVIDLDPYGTAANFFDAAVQSVRNDGGLLCVTCTDAGVWASNGYPEKCFALYGGIPMKGAHSHEAGLRLVLHAIASAAAKYGLAIQPQLSLSIDFYCRVFVTVTRSPAAVKFQAGKTMTVYNCDQGCGAWTTQPLLRNNATRNKRGSGHFYKYTMALAPTAPAPRCAHCGTKTHLAGPMYAGALHSAPFIRRILDDLPSVSTDVYGTTDRIRGMLNTALEELAEEAPAMKTTTTTEDGTEEAAAAPTKEDRLAATDPMPFFFQPTVLAKAMHCNTPHEDAVRGALLHLGYQVTRSHCKPGSIKTDAPWGVLWEMMRAWVRTKAPVKVENIRPGTAAYTLLRLGEGGEKDKQGGQTEAEPAKIEVIFDEKLGRENARRGGRLVRYQVNPRENWGPMNRAKGH